MNSKENIKRSLEQKRAQFSLCQIQNIEKEKDEKWQAKYTSYVKSLPATILMCGLGQAMAMLRAKAKGDMTTPHGRLYQDVQWWLCAEEEKGIFPKGKDLMEALTDTDMDTYLRAQAESLALLVWLKKFATAFLKDDPGAITE